MGSYVLYLSASNITCVAPDGSEMVVHEYKFSHKFGWETPSTATARCSRQKTYWEYHLMPRYACYGVEKDKRFPIYEIDTRSIIITDSTLGNLRLVGYAKRLPGRKKAFEFRPWIEARFVRSATAVAYYYEDYKHLLTGGVHHWNRRYANECIDTFTLENEADAVALKLLFGV